MIKVAIVHHLSPKTNYTRLLQRGFVESGNSEHILLYGNKKENVIDLPSARNVWSSHLYPFQIFRQLLRDQPNIVHIQYEFSTFGPFWANLLVPFLLFFMKLTRSRIVITVHSVIPTADMDNELVEKFFPKLARTGVARTLIKFYLVLLYGTIIRFSDKIIVHGNYYKTALIESYKAPPWKIDTISHGVNEKTCVNNTTFKSWKKRVGRHKVILFFGDVSPRKDIETLIRAFDVFVRKHQDYLLIIAGREEARYRPFCSGLRSTVRELGVSANVTFTGFISDEEIHVLYSISEFIVLPYLYGFEGPSGPLAFAIEHGIPIIGNKVGHLKEEINNMKEGILIPPRNVQALSQAMAKLALDRALRKRISNNLTKKAKTEQWRAVAARTYDLYDQLITSS
jgi:glycosyltransferase involved in cell wall biosynthesis